MMSLGSSLTSVSLVPYGSGEVVEIEKEALQKLRKAIDDSGDPLLVNNKIESTDENLLMYLRCRNYDIESALIKLQRTMYVRRIRYPEVFETFYPSSLYKAFDTRGGGVLKNRDAWGRHVFYLKVSSWDVDLISADEVCQSALMAGFEMLRFEETQRKGIVCILDTSGFSFKMARQANPMIIQKYITIMLHASPLKIKGVHICNAPNLFNIPFKLVKMFLPRKMNKRIHVHGGSLKSLHEFISPEILPDIFGGKLSEYEALDQDLIDMMYTPEKEAFYEAMLANCKSLPLN